MYFRHIRINAKHTFCILWIVLLTSRILVLTDNYDWPINPVLLEEIYLVLTVGLVVMNDRGKIKLRWNRSMLVWGILLLHTLLWGVVFVDQRFGDLIASFFKSQIMFVAIIGVTIWAVRRIDVAERFLDCCFYTLAVILAYYFITNISELDLSNLVNIMSKSDRTRASFGFGHYNTVGVATACGIVIRETVKKNHTSSVKKILDFAVLIIMVCMMLASASRSALTGLVVYFAVYYSWTMDKWPLSKNMIRALKWLRNFLVAVVAVWSLLEVDYMELLVQSQRVLIFTHTLPMFFSSERTLLGLGYASNVVYASGETPYVTYWLDNAYAYYLVTTGIVGFLLIMTAVTAVGVGIRKKVNAPFGRETASVYAMYLYISLFECILFSSGTPVNCIYIPWLLLFISKEEKEKTNERHERYS